MMSDVEYLFTYLLAIWVSSLKKKNLFQYSAHFYFYFLLLFFLFVVDFVIHWNETAMGLHVFPIPIPPPTSLSTHSL